MQDEFKKNKDEFERMQGEFERNIDLVINESQKPILIIGNLGDGKFNYLRENYISNAVDLGKVYAFSDINDDLISNYNPSKLPTWYSSLLKLCAENENEKCLTVFFDLHKAKGNMLTSLYQIVSNEDGKFNLPENANIVCTMDEKCAIANGLELPESFLECFTVVDAHDKSNITINWNNGRTR